VREAAAGRWASLALFFVIAAFRSIGGGVAAGAGVLPLTFTALIGGSGIVNVLAQLSGGLGARIAAATARVWLGVFLVWIPVLGWIVRGFDPRQAGAYAALAGGVLVAVQEWRGLWEEPAPPGSS